MKNKQLALEQALARLEEIADALESGEISLEQSMSLFEEADEISKYCTEKIDTAEAKLQILTKKENGFQLLNEKE